MLRIPSDKPIFAQEQEAKTEVMKSKVIGWSKRTGVHRHGRNGAMEKHRGDEAAAKDDDHDRHDKVDQVERQDGREQQLVGQ